MKNTMVNLRRMILRQGAARMRLMIVAAFFAGALISLSNASAATIVYDGEGAVLGINNLFVDAGGSAGSGTFNIAFDDFQASHFTSNGTGIGQFDQNVFASNDWLVPAAQSIFELFDTGLDPETGADANPSLFNGCESHTECTMLAVSAEADFTDTERDVYAFFAFRSDSPDANPDAADHVFNRPFWSTLMQRTNYGSFAVTAVPVPPAVWLLGTGLLGLVGWQHRRRLSIKSGDL